MNRHRFLLAGALIESNWDFRTPVVRPRPSDARTPDLTFDVVEEPPAAGAWNPLTSGGTNPHLRRGRVGTLDVIRAEGVGDLWIMRPDLMLFHLTGARHQHQVEVVFFGALIADWLERRGMTLLHGSAVANETVALGILGPKGTGKSTLALRLGRLGWRMMTDDMLGLSLDHNGVRAWPTFPQVRLWPRDAELLLGTIDGLERFHPDYEKLRVALAPDQFEIEPKPLVALYLPERASGVTTPLVRPLTAADATVRLVGNAFAPYLNNPTRQAGVLTKMAAIRRSVGVFRLMTPADPSSTEAAAHALSEHATGLA
jgi:hypothetical protein